MKLIIAIIAIFAASEALAQVATHQESVKFGDEVVTLKLTNHDRQMTESGEFDQVAAKLETERDPNEAERLWGIMWENGEPTALHSLGLIYEERGDHLQAYAYLYALNEFAKYSARLTPPGPVRKRYFTSISQEMNKVDRLLTPAQKKVGVKMAANLMRSNPACCSPM